MALDLELDITLDDGNVGGGGLQQVTVPVTVNINAVNSTPVIQNLGAANVFTEGGAAVLLDNDANADLSDTELDFLNDYHSAILTVARQGGANHSVSGNSASSTRDESSSCAIAEITSRWSGERKTAGRPSRNLARSSEL